MLKKFFIVLFFFIFSSSLIGQVTKYKDIDWRIYHSLKWKNYVDYRSNEWINMSIEEKKSLLQIPIEELKLMSTDALIQVSIDCYYTRRIGKFSTINSYYDEIYNNFNGFRELTAREDVCQKMIKYYKDLDLHASNTSPAGLTVKEQVQIIEYLLVHPKIFVKLKLGEFDQLFFNLRKKFEEKTTMTAIYSEQDMIPNFYALARILVKKDQQTSIKLHNVDNIDLFLGSGIFLTRETRDQILNICNGL